MGNRRLHRIECIHMFGTPESERLKVTALIFSPTALPLQKADPFILRHGLLKGGFRAANGQRSAPSEIWSNRWSGDGDGNTKVGILAGIRPPWKPDEAEKIPP